jgi:hypothetical protein
MNGPRWTGASTSSPQSRKAEVVATLMAIQQVRQTCDHTELLSVKYARKAGLSWAEIAAALGGHTPSGMGAVARNRRDAARGRGVGPFSLNDTAPERYSSPG